jgi:ABC-type branched-subunit amino acid transport system substrate-binding protein
MVERRREVCKKVLVFVVMLSFFLGGVKISGAVADGPIKIGLMATFSGILERQGIEMRDGALLALDQFQKKAKGQSFELLVGDDKGNPQAAVAEAQTLIREKKVSAILGPFNNSCALAMAPVVSEARIPMVTLATHPDLTSSLQRYVFRGNISDDVLGKVMVDYTVTILGGLAGDKVGLLYEDSPYGKAGMEVVSQRIKRYGLNLAAVESYPSGAVDLSAQMKQFKQAGVKILIVYGTMVDAQTVMQWVIGSGLGARVLASTGWESTHLLTQVPKGLDGVIVAGYTYLLPDSLLYLGPARIWHRDPALNGQYQLVTGDLNAEEYPAWAAFYKAFRTKYSRNPDMIAGYAYSNMLCLLEAMERVNFDPNRIVEGLEGTENFQTVFEHYINYHDENHSGMKYIDFSTYQGGKIEMATKDKSLDSTKMRERGAPVEVGAYRGEIFSMPPNAAAFFVLHLGFGYPPFMKEMKEMGLYGGFRSDFEFHGIKSSYSGTISNGKDKIVIVKMSFRTPERAIATLNLEATKESVKGKTEVEAKPEEMRDADAGVSYAGGEWAGYKRKGSTLIFAKGVVPLSDLKAVLDAEL